ncbi:DNA alkylation repair protein [Sungkyunkwania multivorans]|uniref:DNA alkylation repair protein n=1 Tax=Sungkyunkwania multivorans TaxID=1173618 RepID=A0ABW3CY15_9FLAO
MNFEYHLAHCLQEHSNATDAKAMKAYLKGKFEFYGIKTPKRRELLKEVLKSHVDEVQQQLDSVVYDLYSQNYRELHMCGMELYYKFKNKKYMLGDIAMIKYLITTHSWWDTVDYIAKWILGGYLLKFPEEKRTVIDTFSSAHDMWLNRSAILFQLGYKAKTDSEELFKQCKKHADSDEFFIKKAIGWALREFGKTDPEAVLAFVNSTTLKPLSRKEAIRNIIK